MALCDSFLGRLAAVTIAFGLVTGTASAEYVEGVVYPEFDPANFGPDSHLIRHPYWSAETGDQKVYEGQSIDEGNYEDHRFVQTVTGLTKLIAGVRVAVFLEEDYQGGTLIEQEIAFNAQDKDGNIWYLGELYEVFEEGQLVGGRVWVHGVPSGAFAGIRIYADAKVGSSEVAQGYAPPPFHWTDSGQVVEEGLRVVTPAGIFEDVIIVDQRDQETEAGVFQTKYFAKGVGLVRVGFKGNDPSQEELVLTEHRMLTAEELARHQAKAMEIDARGYSYNATTPVALIQE